MGKRMTLTPAPLDVVRRVMATAVLTPDNIGEQLGEITLRPHQRRAASRLAALIAQHGGAMLAEPVGVGKTYTALAVAASHSGGLLVVAPAALRAMWGDAARRCGVAIAFATHEAFSRAKRPPEHVRFIIVDEAHRLRTRTTKRYALLADLCRTTDVLLVTATPVQNSANDLAAQLALFLGRVAWSMSEEQLVEYVVRDSGDLAGTRPRLDGPHRITLDVDDDCLDDILALPPPVPAKDEAVSNALLTYSLVHQWTSSRGALVASLKRRRSRGLALTAALEAGRRPTRAELTAWTHASDALQLAFPELVTPHIADDVDASALLAALEGHSAGIDTLLRRIRNAPDPDAARADALRAIRRRHPGERIIAFCQYAETVDVLRARLARDAGVAALTAAGARVASGRIGRDELLTQFTPAAHAATREVERVELLITTDLLSEGLNLQEASVIVHLDLPWNPARLDQRVGRALRLGSRHEVVTVYNVTPPASADRLLRLESRLRDKLSVAQRTVGVAGHILPSLMGGATRMPSVVEQRSTFEHVLRAWAVVDTPGDRAARSNPIVSAVAANVAGFLALVRTSRGAMFVADVGAGVETRIEIVSRIIHECTGSERSVSASRANVVDETLTRWLIARRGADTVNLHAASAARSRRAALARVAQALARTPRHQRARLAPLADAARAIASAPLGEGAERILEVLVRSELPDEAWLRSLVAFGELNVRSGTGRDTRSVDVGEIVAVILLEPTDFPSVRNESAETHCDQ